MLNNGKYLLKIIEKMKQIILVSRKYLEEKIIKKTNKLLERIHGIFLRRRT